MGPRFGASVLSVLGFVNSANGQACVPRKPEGRDSILVYASVAGGDRDPDPIHILRGTVLQEFVMAFPRVPSIILPARAVAGMPGHPDPTGKGAGAPFGELRFTLASDGTVSAVRLTLPTTDPPLDSAMVRTARVLDAAKAPFFAEDQRDTLQIRVQLAVGDKIGSFPLPILSVWEPIVQDRPATLQPSKSYPTWPRSMEQARIEDDVVVQFRVSKTGRAMTDSVRVIQGMHQEYIDAVIAVLPSYRWTPAIVGGCPAEQWTQMPFMFHFK